MWLVNLKKLFLQDLSCHIEENAPLAQYCTFGVGGAAKFLVAPFDASDIIRIMRARKRYKFPLF